MTPIAWVLVGLAFTCLGAYFLVSSLRMGRKLKQQGREIEEAQKRLERFKTGTG